MSLFLSRISRWMIVFFCLAGSGANALATTDVLEASLESTPGSTSLTLTFKRKITHQIVAVRDTRMIALDLEELQIGPRLSSLATQVKNNDPLLKKIRVANFNKTTARLVFYLKTAVKPPKIRQVASGNAGQYQLLVSFQPVTPPQVRQENPAIKTQEPTAGANKAIASEVPAANSVAAAPIAAVEEPVRATQERPSDPMQSTSAPSQGSNGANAPTAVSMASSAVKASKPEANPANSPMAESTQNLARPATPALQALRWTMLAVHQGNTTGDYTALYAQLSTSIQNKIRPDELAKALKGFRERNIDLSSVSQIEPVFFRKPWEEPKGTLNVNGYFPTRPQAIRFSIAYKPAPSGWRIDALNLDAPNLDELANSAKSGQAPGATAKKSTAGTAASGKAEANGVRSARSVSPAGAPVAASSAENRSLSGESASSGLAQSASNTPSQQLSPPANGQARQPAIPLADILRSTFLFIHAGNISGNYSQLYLRLSHAAQGRITPEQLAQSFEEFRLRKIDLAEVAQLNPVLVGTPSIDSHGITNLAGYFPTRPLAIHFAIALKPIAQSWEIEGIRLAIPSTTGQIAPQPAQSAERLATPASATGPNHQGSGGSAGSTSFAGRSAGTTDEHRERSPSGPTAIVADQENKAAGDRTVATAGQAAMTVADTIRSAILAANHGNLTGDYSPLHSRLSASVQSKIRTEQLAKALKGFRDRKIDLSGAANLEPVLFRQPWEDPQGILNVNGYFPTKPQAVRFSIGLHRLADSWRIQALNLDTPTAEELAAALKSSNESARALPRPEKNNAKAEPAVSKPASTRNFESSHLDWSTDPPTASKW